MLIQSSFLLLAVIQSIIPGSQSQTTETTPVSKDKEYCAVINEDQCQHDAVMADCPIKCPVPFKDCRPPWQWVDKQCFQVVYEGVVYEGRELTWSSARVYCNVADPSSEGLWSSRGDLAVVNGTQQQALYDYMQNTKRIPYGQYWIGGSDLYKDEHWYWVNGHNITDYPPYIQSTGECIYLINEPIDLIPFPLLGNEGCGATLPFVCEKFWNW